MSQENVDIVRRGLVGFLETGQPDWDPSRAFIAARDGLVYEVRDGKQVRIDYFNSREQALQAAGLSTSQM